MDQSRARRIRLPRRWWTRAALVAAVLAAVAVPAAWASHEFSDVPDSSPHHDDVSAIAGVGITTGCAPNLYCPDQAVRRDQMASFLRRGLGRLAQAGSIGPIALTDSFQDIAVRSITTGGAPGGIGIVLVHGEFTAGDTLGALASLHHIEYRLMYQNAGQFSTASRVSVGPTTGANVKVSASKTNVWQVPTGTSRTFTLQARRAVGTDPVQAETPYLTVLYVPFGADGT